MSDEIKNGVAAEAPKKNRRGISNETRAVTQLKFHEKDAAANGLFIGHLEEATINWSVAKEGSNFAGLKMPYLTFHFASQHANEVEKRHVFNTLFPIPSNVSTIPGGESEWQVNNVFNWIKHILDVFYLRGRLLTEDEENALLLPFEDFDENNNYIVVEPQEVLNGYATVFTNVVAMLNGTLNLKDGETPKPCYKDANGKPIAVWMKLIRCRKTKKGWINVNQSGDIGFDSFTGSGAIELFKGQGTMPAILRFDPAKESLTPQDTRKEPNLNINNMGGVMLPTGIPNAMPMDNSAFAAAANGDMPF